MIIVLIVFMCSSPLFAPLPGEVGREPIRFWERKRIELPKTEAEITAEQQQRTMEEQRQRKESAQQERVPPVPKTVQEPIFFWQRTPIELPGRSEERIEELQQLIDQQKATEENLNEYYQLVKQAIEARDPLSDALLIRLSTTYNRKIKELRQKPKEKEISKQIELLQVINRLQDSQIALSHLAMQRKIFDKIIRLERIEELQSLIDQQEATEEHLTEYYQLVEQAIETRDPFDVTLLKNILKTYDQKLSALSKRPDEVTLKKFKMLQLSFNKVVDFALDQGIAVEEIEEITPKLTVARAAEAGQPITFEPPKKQEKQGQVPKAQISLAEQVKNMLEERAEILIYKRSKKDKYNMVASSELFKGSVVPDATMDKLGTVNQGYFLKDIAKRYKIHLMPTEKNFVSVIETLLDAVEKDPELQKLIGLMKFIDDPTNLTSERTGRTLPEIVIYPAAGKESAQALLDKIYALFKNEPGLDTPLEYNYRLTPLIRFAQGDADAKVALIEARKEPGRKKPHYLEGYFEGDKMIYFNFDKFQQLLPQGQDLGVTDFHLRHPQTGEILK